jgi:polyhydroxyalkanoate synthesis regulator phasin
VLALLGHYVQHPLRPALQRAAGEYAAARRLRGLESSVTRLQSEIAEKREAIGRLEAQVADFEHLKSELRELADAYTRRTAAELAGGQA